MVPRLLRLVPGIWLGLLLGVAVLAAPAGFALLPAAEAGRLAARWLLQEAYLSLALGVVVLVGERLAARRRALKGEGSQFSLGMVLALGTLLCTVIGYFGLQPQMAQARMGQGPWTFGQLHAASAAFYAVKMILVAVLAWRATGSGRHPGVPGSGA